MLSVPVDEGEGRNAVRRGRKRRVESRLSAAGGEDDVGVILEEGLEWKGYSRRDGRGRCTDVDVAKEAESWVCTREVEFMGAVLGGERMNRGWQSDGRLALTSGWSGATPYRTRPWGAHSLSNMCIRSCGALGARESSRDAT